MANFVLRVPTTNFKSLSVSASSNGSGPGISTATQNGGPAILELPLEKIRRPLMRTRANDPIKVQELMDSIQQIGLQVPIDVLEVDGVYYGFSGCHRYEAHQRLGLPTHPVQSSPWHQRNFEASPPLSFETHNFAFEVTFWFGNLY